MVRSPQGCLTLAVDPLPCVRGFYQLIAESRLAASYHEPAAPRIAAAVSVIWLVIAMALLAADSIPKVWRRLHPSRDHPEPTDSAFIQARRRLGVVPLRRLFHETAWPMATHETVGALLRSRRPLDLDWCCVENAPFNQSRR